MEEVLAYRRYDEHQWVFYVSMNGIVFEYTIFNYLISHKASSLELTKGFDINNALYRRIDAQHPIPAIYDSDDFHRLRQALIENDVRYINNAIINGQEEDDDTDDMWDDDI